MKALIAAAAALGLAGCQTSGRPPVPASLLTCSAEPAVPPKPRSQASVATYTLDLAEAGRDCRSKLGRVRGLIGTAQ